MADSSLNLLVVGSVTIASFKDNSILDVVTIQRIGKELFDLVEVDNRRKIVLDFGNVRFLSSQALGVLLTLRRKAEKTGAKVAMAALRPELARVFKITSLDKMFDFFDDLPGAVKHFGETLPPAAKS